MSELTKYKILSTALEMGVFTRNEMAERTCINPSTIGNFLSRNSLYFEPAGTRDHEAGGSGRRRIQYRIAPKELPRVSREIATLVSLVGQSELAESVSQEDENYRYAPDLDTLQAFVDELRDNRHHEDRDDLIEAAESMYAIEVQVIVDRDLLGLHVADHYRERMKKISFDIHWYTNGLDHLIEEHASKTSEEMAEWLFRGTCAANISDDQALRPLPPSVVEDIGKLNEIIRALSAKSPAFAGSFRIAAIATMGRIASARSTDFIVSFYRFCYELNPDELLRALRNQISLWHMSQNDAEHLYRIVRGLNEVSNLYENCPELANWCLGLLDCDNFPLSVVPAVVEYCVPRCGEQRIINKYPNVIDRFCRTFPDEESFVTSIIGSNEENLSKQWRQVLSLQNQVAANMDYRHSEPVEDQTLYQRLFRDVENNIRYLRQTYHGSPVAI